MDKNQISRRTTLKSLGLLGASTLIASSDCTQSKSQSACKIRKPGDVFQEIYNKVNQTLFIDTHEHLIEESRRFDGSEPRADDWTYLMSHYFDSDMLSAGMSQLEVDKFFSKKYDSIKKWQLLKPYWPFIKNTGYGQAVRITIDELYNIDDISDNSIERIQSAYDKTRKPGFYKHILQDVCKIESCQINCLDTPFTESALPELLMQDLSIVGMFAGPDFKAYQPKTGIQVKSLSDWYKVIDWWYNKYGSYAVAVKSQDAYGRDIDYQKVAAEVAEPIFSKKLNQETITPTEKKNLEDHLFWYAVNKANEFNLPVKLHTGYYAGQNNMPLSRVRNNPASACDLCRVSPETTFVFMHICYPYYEEMIALAKHYSNAYIDMCWSWIINPIAAKDFLKKYLVSAPANKIFTFGGDYGPVEPVIGHSRIARLGIACALTELVNERCLTINDAMDLISPIMHDNAVKTFNIAQKLKALNA